MACGIQQCINITSPQLGYHIGVCQLVYVAREQLVAVAKPIGGGRPMFNNPNFFVVLRCYAVTMLFLLRAAHGIARFYFCYDLLRLQEDKEQMIMCNWKTIAQWR